MEHRERRLEEHDHEPERDRADPAADDVRHAVLAQDRERVLDRAVDELERPRELDEARQRVAHVRLLRLHVVAVREDRADREPVQPAEARVVRVDAEDLERRRRLVVERVPLQVAVGRREQPALEPRARAALFAAESARVLEQIAIAERERHPLEVGPAQPLGRPHAVNATTCPSYHDAQKSGSESDVVRCRRRGPRGEPRAERRENPSSAGSSRIFRTADPRKKTTLATCTRHPLSNRSRRRRACTRSRG